MFVRQKEKYFEQEIPSHDLIILAFIVNDVLEFKYENVLSLEVLNERLMNVEEYGVDGIISHLIVKGIIPTIVLLESWPLRYVCSHY